MQSELAYNVIFFKSKLSTLEDVRPGIPDMEDEINNKGEAIFDLNMTSFEGGFSRMKKLCPFGRRRQRTFEFAPWPFDPTG